jgi:hypothetical protein
MTIAKKIHVRPRFTLISELTVEELFDKSKAAVNDKEAEFTGQVRIGYLSIYPKAEDHHYWSPHLSITIEPDEEDHEKTMLSGLYGPSPAVWTMFVFIYGGIAMASLIISIIGFANLSLGEPAEILWTLPLLLLLLVSIYVTSYFGAQKGHSQIEAIDVWFRKVILN